MIIARHNGTPPLPKRLPKPATIPPEPAQTPTPPPGKGEVFLRSSGAAARKLSQIGGFTNGASFGYLGGALAASSLGASGPVCWVAALASAGVGGVAGYKVMGNVSDWAGRSAARLSPKHALGAEVAGRTALNLAADLVLGSPVTAAVGLSVTAGWGAFQAARTPKAQ
ncbi:MAG: hypothetical protein KF760_18650 [Candidatus Eremiobacteraeota bacterium]|nr:hypothetical protein [Candidatus Eremiobacteraeota bacterium]MCW5867324.1 hypothetical protein [Candidatus Eremiobacteraeota bacterium]